MSILPQQYPENLDVDIFVNYEKIGTPSYDDYHYHNEHYELCFILSGICEYGFNYEKHTLSTYEIIFIDKNISHYSERVDPGNSERVIVNFNNAFLAKINIDPIILFDIFSKPIFKLPKKYITEMTHLFTKLVIESDYQSVFSNDLIEGYMREILVQLYRIAKEIPSKKSLPTNTIIEATTKYICEHFNEEITLDVIADYNHVNKFYLSKLFKEVMGINLFKYINTIRIHNATTLLTETNKTISEISQECGYNSPKHFCEVFRQIKGISASRFRKQAKNLKSE